MRKIITAAGALLACLGIVLAAPAQAAGPKPAVVPRGVSADALQAAPSVMVAPTTCREGAHYPADGKIKFNICFDHTAALSNGTFVTYASRVWNVPSSAGGATGDLVTNVCKFGGSGFACANAGATDGNTVYLGGPETVPTSSTFWVQIYGKRGTANWCHRVFLNHGGGTSITGC